LIQHIKRIVYEEIQLDYAQILSGGCLLGWGARMV